MDTITDEMLTMPAGVLVKTTLVDFPGRVACSFFLKGCNLRCPYCYNVELVIGEQAEKNTLVSAATLLEHLSHRKNVLSGFVLSGGEPLLNPLTPYLIRQARSMGYKIKLDTNGTLPDQLQTILADENLKPDFIAMDIKTDPERYKTTIAPKNLTMKTDPAQEKNKNRKTGKRSEQLLGTLSKDDFSLPIETYENKILRSVKLISTLPPDNREFRTVLVPGLVAEKDLDAIAKILPEDASWQLAQFRNENCLDPSYNDIPPYIDARIRELESYAKKLIPGAVLR